MIEGLFLVASGLLPQKMYIKFIRPWLTYAGSKDNERIWVGSRVVLAILMAIAGLVIPINIFPGIVEFFGYTKYFTENLYLLTLILFPILFFIITLLIFYLHIQYVIDGRKKMVEAVLPDYLYLVSNNLKSGMPPFNAFSSAIRPEFGPLSEEIRIATKKSLGVDSFPEALKQIARRIDSSTLQETAKFFSQALRSGGHLSELIETTAHDLRKTEALKKELISSTRMYAVFIVFVVVVASPMLLAVSVQFLNVIASVQEKTTASIGSTSSAAQDIGLSAQGVSISSDVMKVIAYAMLFCNSLLASIFIGMISGNKLINGFKYAPIMFIVSIILFNIMLQGVGSMLGGVIV